MNEVTRIHLGRQQFTVSVAAHKSLRAYLDGIREQVGDQEVVDEVELRMAELLTERGITGEKVILEKDVTYLKQQLGQPADFKEEAGESEVQAEEQGARQLFRDTDHAMIAGVAAGLAAYFGVDVLLIRILFIIGTVTGGWGILIYLVLWLLVPPAQSSSDRLRMQGKSVTLAAIKDAVHRADATGAAKRAGKTAAPVINSIFQFILKVTGIGFILGGLSGIFGLLVVWLYMAGHNGQLFEENLFPVGRREHVLADLMLGVLALAAVFIVLSGLAMFKRRWPVRGWITGVIAVVFFLGLAGSVVLSADAAPKVRDRYLSRSHTVTRSVGSFQDVTIEGEDVDYRWEYADSYSVSFHYFDNPNISKIKTTVSNNLLKIDTSEYQRERPCTMLCMFPAYNLLITVKGPQPLSSTYPKGIPKIPNIPEPKVTQP